MNQYFSTDGIYYPNTTPASSSPAHIPSFNYSTQSYSSTASGYGESTRLNTFQDNFDRNAAIRNSRSGERFYAEESSHKLSGFGYGGLDKLKSFTPTNLAAPELRRPFLQEGGANFGEHTRPRKGTFDSGRTGGNMYASQMVLPSSTAGSKFGGLGGLSSMGRTVAEDPLSSYQHKFQHKFGADHHTSYTPMADSLRKQEHFESLKSFKPFDSHHLTTDSFKPNFDPNYRPSATTGPSNLSPTKDYYGKDTIEFIVTPPPPELQSATSDNSDVKKAPLQFQQQSLHMPQPRLEFKPSPMTIAKEEMRLSPVENKSPMRQGQPPLMFVSSDGSRPSNNNQFKKKLVFTKDDRTNPETLRFSKGSSTEEPRESPSSLNSKSEPLIPGQSVGESLRLSGNGRQGRMPCKNDFVIGKKLGKGKFGDVHIVKHKQLGFVCALKSIPKSMLKEEQLQNQIIRELKIQCFLNHFNITSMYGYFNDEENVYFLLELCCDGQLYNIIKERKRLPEAEAKQIVWQICEAAEYLHRQRVIHRDLKLQNIIMHEGIAKMCDFGWAVYSEDEYRTTFCFSPVYRPPELIMSGKYDEKVDIWAIGILTYELLIGKIPFKINSEEDLIKICKEDIRFPEYVEISNDAKDFIRSILKKDPKDRFDIEELMMHPFLKQAQPANTFDLPSFL